MRATHQRPASRLPWTASFLAVFSALCVAAAEVPPDPGEGAIDLTELSLEELVEIQIPVVQAASKREQKVTEAPSSVTVITSEEIKRYGHRTLADVLRSVQGLYVSYDRNYAFLGTRGVNLGDFNGRILLLIDGHRVNNDLSDGAFIDTAFVLDLDLIDRVEIIRGPGSVLYGNNAFFGVINVITRDGSRINGGEVSGEYATFDAVKGRLTYGKSFTNGLQFVLSGTCYDSDGEERLFFDEFNTTNQNNGVAEGLDDDSFQSAFGSVKFRDFTLQGAFIHREKGNPTAQYLTTFNDPRLRTTDRRAYVNLKYEHSFEDFADVRAQVYYDRNDFEISYPSGATLFQEEDSGQWWGMELQLTRRLWERHVVIVGAEYRDDFHQQQRVFEPGTGNVFTDVSRDQRNYGFYAQGDVQALTNLQLTAGVRYDHHGEVDAVNPRVAAIYSPFERSTFKAIYGTAFRAPNFLELSLSGGSDIDPEQITAYELVYEQGIGRRLRSSVSAFYNRMDDLIAFESGGFTNFNAEAKGVEVALEGIWTNGLMGRVSYTYQDARNRTSGGELTDSPEHLAKFNLSVPVFRDKVFAGLEFQYMSTRRTVRTTPLGATVAGEDAGGFGVVNLTLFSRNLVKDLEFSASVYNLLDRNYGDPATRFHQQDIITQDGRSFRLKFVYRF